MENQTVFKIIFTIFLLHQIGSVTGSLDNKTFSCSKKFPTSSGRLPSAERLHGTHEKQFQSIMEKKLWKSSQSEHMKNIKEIPLKTCLNYLSEFENFANNLFYPNIVFNLINGNKCYIPNKKIYKDNITGIILRIENGITFLNFPRFKNIPLKFIFYACENEGYLPKTFEEIRNAELIWQSYYNDFMKQKCISYFPYQHNIYQSKLEKFMDGQSKKRKEEPEERFDTITVGIKNINGETIKSTVNKDLKIEFYEKL